MRLLLGLAASLVPAIAIAQPGSSGSLEPPTEIDDAAAAADAAGADGAARSRVAVLGPGASDGSPPGAAPLDDPEAPTRDAPAVPVERIGLERRVDRDASAGRALFTDTALTPARGDLGLQARFPAAAYAAFDVSYGLTDRIAIGVGTAVADGEDAILGLEARGQLWHNDRAAIAVGLHHHRPLGDGSGSLTSPSVVASSCLDGASCVALFSVSLNAFISEGDALVPVFAGASWALGRTYQFVGEINTASDDGTTRSFGFFGARLASHSFTLDAGVVFGSIDKLYCAGYCTSDMERALPFAALSARL